MMRAMSWKIISVLRCLGVITESMCGGNTYQYDVRREIRRHK